MQDFIAEQWSNRPEVELRQLVLFCQRGQHNAQNAVTELFARVRLEHGKF